jgi:hypothetical protein
MLNHFADDFYDIMNLIDVERIRPVSWCLRVMMDYCADSSRQCTVSTAIITIVITYWLLSYLSL